MRIDNLRVHYKNKHPGSDPKHMIMLDDCKSQAPVHHNMLLDDNSCGTSILYDVDRLEPYG